MGYPYGKKGWRLYDLETGEYFIFRDVFFEHVFPFTGGASDQGRSDMVSSLMGTPNCCNEVVDNVVTTSCAPNVEPNGMGETRASRVGACSQ